MSVDELDINDCCEDLQSALIELLDNQGSDDAYDLCCDAIARASALMKALYHPCD